VESRADCTDCEVLNLLAISGPYATSLTIDQTSPVADTPLTLTLAASNATEMWLDGDLVDDATTFAWIPYATSAAVNLLSGDGAKTVSVKYRSADSIETAPILRAITLTTTAPLAPDPVPSGGGGSFYSSAITFVDSATTINEPTHAISIGFTDLTASHWSHDIVMDLASAGVISGYPDGTFQPDTAINRAELTKIAIEAFGLSAATFASADQNFQVASFADLDPSAWYTPYVNQAKQLGVVNGFGDGLFRPSQQTSRAEALKILSLASGIFPDDQGSTQAYFVDVAADAWYASFVTWATERGMIQGYEITASVYEFKRELRIGHQGQDVGVLQHLLQEFGHYRGVASYYFGPVTQAGLINFQAAELLPGSYTIGVLDAATQAKLYALSGINQAQSYFEFRPDQPITRAEVAKLTQILRDLKNNGSSEYASVPRLQVVGQVVDSVVPNVELAVPSSQTSALLYRHTTQWMQDILSQIPEVRPAAEGLGAQLLNSTPSESSNWREKASEYLKNLAR
jgi:hypothetical protein